MPEQLIINGKEFNFEQLDPNDIEKHEQLRAALSQLLGNTNASTFQSPSQINPVTSTPLIPPSMPDFNENSAQPSTVKNYSLFPSFANLKRRLRIMHYRYYKLNNFYKHHKIYKLQLQKILVLI
ncbi:hypothetical protein Q5E55_020490 (plasmid) [Acinetobacter baumannii]